MAPKLRVLIAWMTQSRLNEKAKRDGSHNGSDDIEL
jgi:hypothetical protein